MESVSIRDLFQNTARYAPSFEAAYRNLVHVRSCFSNRCNVQYVPSRATTPRS